MIARYLEPNVYTVQGTEHTFLKNYTTGKYIMQQNTNIMQILKIKLQTKRFENFADVQERLTLLKPSFDVSQLLMGSHSLATRGTQVAKYEKHVRGRRKRNHTVGQGPLMAGQTMSQDGRSRAHCVRPYGAACDIISMMVLRLRKMGMERLRNLTRATWEEATPRFKSQSL